MNETTIIALSFAAVAVISMAGMVFALVRSRRAVAGLARENYALKAEVAQTQSESALKEEMTRRQLDDKDASCLRLLADKEEHCRQLVDAQAKTCREAIAAKDDSFRQLMAQKENEFKATLEVLKGKFSELASSCLEAQKANLAETNQNNLKPMLSVLKEQMEKLHQATMAAHDDNTTISHGVEAIKGMTEQLSGIAAALKANTRVQGRSGEDILAQKLREAGLEEGKTFFLQEGTAEDRPDAQVCDAENRWLVIDSKVSLTAYFEAEETDDEALRELRLDAHVASIRGKIDALARKKYPEALSKDHPERNYLPVTVMFVPYEAPLMAALERVPTLWQRAAEGNVLLLTPLTLMAYIRLVYLAWQHEKAERNQQQIVATARELLKRMNEYLVAFEGLGDSIERLRGDYESASRIIVDGPHAQTIAKSAEKLVKLQVAIEGRKGRKLQLARCLAGSGEEMQTTVEGAEPILLEQQT